jgi:hypothetical protein
MSGQNKPKLHLAWCSHKAAKYAVEHWHYSKRMPSTAGRAVYIGVWEDGKYVGSIVFSLGANLNLGKRYGLRQFERCELVRVALREHKNTVTKIVSVALKILKKHSPGLKAVFSYADMGQGHVGVIYQAGNWSYIGISPGTYEYIRNGEILHSRTASDRYGSLKGMRERGFTKQKKANKHLYVSVFDRSIYSRFTKHVLPYPKRGESDTSDTPGHHPGKGGSTPTSPLHSKELTNAKKES